MKNDISVHNKDNEPEYIDAVTEICGKTDDLRKSLFANQVAENRILGEIMIDAMEIFEREAILVCDELQAALSEKSEKIKSLNNLIEKVSGESAFMKSALSGIKSKTVEIDSLNFRLAKFIEMAEKIDLLHKNGTFDLVATVADAINRKDVK